MQIAEGYTKLKEKAVQMRNSVKALETLSTKKEKTLSYAYPCDNYMDKILSIAIVRKALQLFADKYCAKQILDIKADGLLVTESNCPNLYNAFKECCKILDIKEKPKLYISQKLNGINALSVGTDKEPMILISRKSTICLPETELKFLLGHELGHILQKNLMCHTIKGMLDNLNDKSEILGPIVSDLVEVPLNQWYRCTEYTADRAGLICCKDIEAVNNLFRRFTKPNDKKDAMDSYYELIDAHPLFANRLEKINSYHSIMIGK